MFRSINSSRFLTRTSEILCCYFRDSKTPSFILHFFFPPRPRAPGPPPQVVSPLAGWNTELAAMRFSMYCPSTWFSDLSLRFSSLTLSTLELRSSRVFCSSRTWAMSRAFSSCSSPVRSSPSRMLIEVRDSGPLSSRVRLEGAAAGTAGLRSGEVESVRGRAGWTPGKKGNHLQIEAYFFTFSRMKQNFD